MNNIPMRLGASASCFDLYNLERQMDQIHRAPIDFIHYDVVDGRFNRCIILGLPLLKALAPHTHLPIEVHLATYEPERYIEQFIEAGASIVTVHVEGTDDVLGAFGRIRELGAKPALAMRSETEPDDGMLKALDAAEYVIKLTVDPGFSGQPIQPAALDKMRSLRSLMDAHGINTPIAADGNVNPQTVPALKAAGAEMLIGGTSGLILPGRSLCDTARELLTAL